MHGFIVDSPQLNFYQTTSWFYGAIRGSNVFIFNLRGCNESWTHGCGDCSLLSLYDSIWFVVIMWASRETFKAKAWARDCRRQLFNDRLYMRILKLIVLLHELHSSTSTMQTLYVYGKGFKFVWKWAQYNHNHNHLSTCV